MSADYSGNYDPCNNHKQIRGKVEGVSDVIKNIIIVRFAEPSPDPFLLELEEKNLQVGDKKDEDRKACDQVGQNLPAV